jgi:hypothetical protein
MNTDLTADRSTLSSYGAVFDEEGRIANYESLIASNLYLEDDEYSDF